MGGASTRSWGLAALCAAAIGCASSEARMDLSRNPRLYEPTGYRAQTPPDRTAFVAPVVDERQPAPPGGAFPISYLPDREWDRPLVVMVRDVLVQELREGGLFTNLVDRAEPDALVVKPILREFHGGIEEHPTGRRSLAVAALVLEVYGPLPAGGERELLLRKRFYDQQGSNVAFEPPSPRLLMGWALHATMAKVVAVVDQSNVARSGMALEAGLVDR